MRHGYPPVWLSAALLALALMWRMVGAPLTGPQLEDIQTPLWQARVLLPTRVVRILRLWLPGAQEAQAQTIREEAMGEEGQALDRLMNGEDQQTISVYLAQEGRVVEMARSPLAKTPICPPRHGPHVGVLKTAPALMKTSAMPSLIACK